MQRLTQRLAGRVGVLEERYARNRLPELEQEVAGVRRQRSRRHSEEDRGGVVMKSRTVPVGQVTQWLSGGTPNRSFAEYWVGEIPWISASTLKGSEIHESDQHLTTEAVAVGSKMAPVGATLFLVRGSALHNEIRAGLVVAPVCFNQDVKALVPSPRIVPKFLTYSLLGRTQDLLKLVSTAGNSAGVLDTKLVQSFEIFLPPNPEQRAIAEALSDVDGLLGALEALIAKKRAIKQAAIAATSHRQDPPTEI